MFIVYQHFQMDARARMPAQRKIPAPRLGSEPPAAASATASVPSPPRSSRAPGSSLLIPCDPVRSLVIYCSHATFISQIFCKNTIFPQHDQMFFYTEKQSLLGNVLLGIFDIIEGIAGLSMTCGLDFAVPVFYEMASRCLAAQGCQRPRWILPHFAAVK